MANPRKDIPPSFGNTDALLLPAKNYHYFKDNNLYPFDPTAEEHSPINAWWLAECSLLAYETEQNVKAILEKEVPFYDNDGFKWFEKSTSGLDGFGFQSKDKDFAILSFRGTEFYRPGDILQDFGKIGTVLQDIFQDLHLQLETFDGTPTFDVPVVQGFYQQLKSIWPELNAWIERLPPTCNLWLTGHSLGAAISLLVAYQFPDRVAGIYTFGCPCPGSKEFADVFNQRHLNARTFRYVHGNDLVAKGLEFLGSNYQHVGILETLDAESHKNWLEKGLNSILRRDMTDHAPLYYALNCWNLIP